MKAVMVMFDSLNRRMLEPYGCDWVRTPNFTRLAQRALTFDNAYVGSMPCMPARRELHTGRYNFLHRSWGPLEPFDDSVPRQLREAGVHTHLASDHYHYWENGGCTYHTQYTTWEIIRGQEGDPWKGHVGGPDAWPEAVGRQAERSRWYAQDLVNRQYCRGEQHYQTRTFDAGMDFMRQNRDADNWFLHIETFDPHEPYFSTEEFQQLYPHEWDGRLLDWPPYAPVSETPEQIRHLRLMSAALHSMCDAHLGRVLDLFDELDLWDDTLLIVYTDHGFLLGEHDWWAKCAMPFYNEIAHTPLFIWDPRCGRHGERRRALVQTIDLAPTLLEFFGRPLPPDMQGLPLRETIASDKPVREAGLFGIHGGHVNVTDGRYVYMRAPATPDNAPLHNYTVMPTHMRDPFSVEELRRAELHPPFAFTKGCPTLRTPAGGVGARPHQFGTLLYDVEADPRQQTPLDDPAVETRMLELMSELMHANDAPAEQFERLGITTGVARS